MSVRVFNQRQEKSALGRIWCMCNLKMVRFLKSLCAQVLTPLFWMCCRVSQQVLCSQAEEYNSRGVLCDASHEGPLRRNPGNHNRNVVARLPTAAEVEFTLSLDAYDTGAMDRTSNMSFRNTLEGQRGCETWHLINSALLNHRWFKVLFCWSVWKTDDIKTLKSLARNAINKWIKLKGFSRHSTIYCIYKYFFPA